MSRGCGCVGALCVCPESWEYMRTELGVSREDMVRKLAPLRRQMEALRAVLASRRG